MKSLILISVLGLSLSAPSFAQEVPNGVSIIRADAYGSGCQPGQVQSVLSPDNKELSFLFDNFISESGTNQAPEYDKKVCIVDMKLSVPPGWSMGLTSTDYRGFAGIEAGGSAQHEALYSFNKDYAGSSFSSYALRGPLNENYFYRHSLRTDLVNWSQCDLREVSLTVRISLVTQSPMIRGGRRPVSMLTLDSMDTSTRQSFTVTWKQCRGGGGGGGVRPPPIPPPGGGGTRPPPIPPGGGGGQVRPGETNDIYQLWDGRDRYLTTDGRLVERGAWVNQGTAFRVYAQPRVRNALIALYSCLDTRINKHFVSTDARCEGMRQERTLGYISSIAQADLVPLVEYVLPGDSRERMATTNANEASGYQAVRTLGFVIRTR